MIVFAVSRSTGISEKAAAHCRTSTPKAFASPHVARRDDIEQELAVAHERDFIGDVAMLHGTSTLATARVTPDEAEILYVPADELRRVLAGLPRDSKPIVDALMDNETKVIKGSEVRKQIIRSTAFARVP